MLFLYSQDLSNSKTVKGAGMTPEMFLYSQDLSNSKTYNLYVDTIKDVFVLSRFK